MAAGEGQQQLASVGQQCRLPAIHCLVRVATTAVHQHIARQNVLGEEDRKRHGNAVPDHLLFAGEKREPEYRPTPLDEPSVLLGSSHDHRAASALQR